MATAAEPWEAVESSLARAEQLLLMPTAEACEAVMAELEAVERSLRAAQPASAPNRVDPDRARCLRTRLRRVSLLVDNAAVLRLGWARLLSVMAGGYTARGEPAPLEPPSSVAVQG